MFRMVFLLRRLRRIIIREWLAAPAEHTTTIPQRQPERQIKPLRKALDAAAINAQIHALPAAIVRYVVDGDTVIAVRRWREIRIRLDSIDCPEDGQHWGDVAKYGLIKLIGRRRVHIEEHGRDDYGRVLATLYVRHPSKDEWMNVNERMVTLGHAWVMRRYYDHLPPDRQEKLNRLERWARSKNVGLWATPDPTPPWKWRGHMRRPL